MAEVMFITQHYDVSRALASKDKQNEIHWLQFYEHTQKKKTISNSDWGGKERD